MLLQDKLVTMGHWVELYTPVTSTTPGVVACSCTKNTTDNADRACLSCNGVKLAPGYHKFGHETLFWCSAEETDFDLTNMAIDTRKKSHVLSMVEGQTTGVVETQDKAYDNTDAQDYDLRLHAFKRDADDEFTLEFSLDSGATWSPVTLTEVTGSVGYEGSIDAADIEDTGVIRFRLTIERDNIDTLPPTFEILRMRRVKTTGANPQLIRQRGDFRYGHILILRPWTQESRTLDPQRGRVLDYVPDQTWTAPLDFFDINIERDTKACRIDDGDAGPHPFYTYTSSVQQGDRFVVTRANINTSFGPDLFTHQVLVDRRAQEHETTFLVW